MVYSRRSQFYRSRSTFGGYKRRYKPKYKSYKKGWMSGKRQSFQKYKGVSKSESFDIVNADDTPTLVGFMANLVSVLFFVN